MLNTGSRLPEYIESVIWRKCTLFASLVVVTTGTAAEVVASLVVPVVNVRNDNKIFM